MAYDKKISRANPGHVTLVLDDSGSMADALAGTSDQKCRWVERDTGHLFKQLLSYSTEVVGDAVRVKPRYFVDVIEYGSRPQRWGTAGMDIETAVQMYTDHGASLGLAGQLGGTDALAAFQLAFGHLKTVVSQERFAQSFPPMLFHLTDGKSGTDASGVAEQIKQLQTADGHLLVVNALIGTETSLAYKGAADFPGYLDPAEAGPDPDNLRLFKMSSPVPDCIRSNLIEDGVFPNLRAGARLFFDIRTRETLKHALQVAGSLGSRADRAQR